MSLQEHAIHEAGHVLTAKLFENYLFINKVSLAPSTTWTHLENIDDWNGALHVSTRHQKPSDFEADSLMICLWSGIIAYNIFKIGREKIWSNRVEYLEDPNLLDRKGFTGDWQILSKYIPQQAMNKRMHQMEYNRFCILFSLEYLTDNRVWSMLNILANQLVKSENKELSLTEMERLFKKHKFNYYLLTYRLKLFGNFFELKWKQKMSFILLSLKKIMYKN